MAKKIGDLSIEQQEFLSLLILIDEPVPMEIVADMMPIAMTSFWRLVDGGNDPPLICLNESGVISLAPEFPADLRGRLKSLLPQRQLGALLDRSDLSGMTDKLNPGLLLKLHRHTGRCEQTAHCEIRLADQAQISSKYLTAIEHLKNAIQLLINIPNKKRTEERELISCVFDLSMLYFIQGLFREKLNQFLEMIIDICVSTGDLRNLAMARLHLGSWLINAGEKGRGLNELKQGTKLVNEINDDDILAQSLPFSIFYVFALGRYKEALEIFDRVPQKSDMPRDNYGNYIAGLYAGISAAFLGQFHRAIGMIDSNWHLAKSRQIYGLAAALRALLGQVLLEMGKKQAAFRHLMEVKQAAEREGYGLAHYIALGGLSTYYLLEGEPTKASEILLINNKLRNRTGMAGIFVSPWSYEKYFRLYNLTQDHDLRKYLKKMIDEAQNDINIGIRGTAKRLKAKMEMSGHADSEKVLELLQESVKYLKETEDPVQLAKTRIELCRLAYGRGDIEASRKLAMKARKGLSGFLEDKFPADLGFLLDDNSETEEQQAEMDKLENLLLSMTDTLVPQSDYTHLVKQLLMSINRLLQARRIGLFWFEDPEGKSPVLHSAYNISSAIANSESFSDSMALVFETFRKASPLVVDLRKTKTQKKDPTTSMIICLPFRVQSTLRGVVYMDYSFFEYVPDFVNDLFLRKLAHCIDLCIDRIVKYDSLLADMKDETIKSSTDISNASESDEIILKNKKTQLIYKQAGKIASTNATILLTGETGTGKEHMARWIHQQSSRSDKPFVVIDPITITGELFESELFGHEKGAFTGANRQKPGRIELANRGTLFIDEIGEIPPTIQVKLLRVIQEKTFVRVGGTRTLNCDFRLIVATNRDLEKEVAEGRFREDLFYRINMMHFHLLPLRERKEDIISLARFFLKKFSAKHNKSGLQLSRENEGWLKQNTWPGNIREMKHVMEKAVLTSDESHLEFQSDSPQKTGTGPVVIDELIPLDDMQRQYIKFVLKQTDGKVSGPHGAASILGMKRSTLRARMKKLGVTV